MNNTKAEIQHLPSPESKTGSIPSPTAAEPANAIPSKWPDYPEPELEPWEKENAEEFENFDHIRGKNNRPTLGVGGQAGGSGKPTEIRK